MDIEDQGARECLILWLIDSRLAMPEDHQGLLPVHTLWSCVIVLKLVSQVKAPIRLLTI